MFECSTSQRSSPDSFQKASEGAREIGARWSDGVERRHVWRTLNGCLPGETPPNGDGGLSASFRDQRLDLM